MAYFLFGICDIGMFPICVEIFLLEIIIGLVEITLYGNYEMPLPPLQVLIPKSMLWFNCFGKEIESSVWKSW